MGLNRSGYYKWRARKDYPNRYEKDRLTLTNLLMEVHKKHPSYGYHRLAREVFDQTGWMFSDNLAHKCCKSAGIRSKARKGYIAPGEESKIFPNEVQGCWNASKPVEIVVSDMTMFKVGKKYWEWTILLDTFNNEILAHMFEWLIRFRFTEDKFQRPPEIIGYRLLGEQTTLENILQEPPRFFTAQKSSNVNLPQKVQLGKGVIDRRKLVTFNLSCVESQSLEICCSE